MNTLIFLLLKVQIVLQSVVPTLRRAHRRKHNAHVELAPSLLFNQERRLFENLPPARAEGFVQVVGSFLVAFGLEVLAVWADEVDGDGPATVGDLAFDCFFGTVRSWMSV